MQYLHVLYFFAYYDVFIVATNVTVKITPAEIKSRKTNTLNPNMESEGRKLTMMKPLKRQPQTSVIIFLIFGSMSIFVNIMAIPTIKLINKKFLILIGLKTKGKKILPMQYKQQYL